MIQGSYAGDVVFDYHAAFFKELTLHVPRDVQKQDMEAVFAMVSSGQLSISGVISNLAQPKDAPSVYARLRNEKDWITAAFLWS